ncbi:MAG: hypothetical protein ABI222_15825 [Opitutaceae bacterium]
MADPDPLRAYYSARALYMAKGLGIEPTGQLLEIIGELRRRLKAGTF